jgi:hypothetical protein
MPALTEADTCRRYVLPKLYAASWTDEQISEQKTFTDGRIVVTGDRCGRPHADLLGLSLDGASCEGTDLFWRTSRPHVVPQSKFKRRRSFWRRLAELLCPGANPIQPPCTNCWNWDNQILQDCRNQKRKKVVLIQGRFRMRLRWERMAWVLVANGLAVYFAIYGSSEVRRLKSYLVTQPSTGPDTTTQLREGLRMTISGVSPLWHS